MLPVDKCTAIFSYNMISAIASTPTLNHQPLHIPIHTVCCHVLRYFTFVDNAHCYTIFFLSCLYNLLTYFLHSSTAHTACCHTSILNIQPNILYHSPPAHRASLYTNGYVLLVVPSGTPFVHILPAVIPSSSL